MLLAGLWNRLTSARTSLLFVKSWQKMTLCVMAGYGAGRQISIGTMYYPDRNLDSRETQQQDAVVYIASMMSSITNNAEWGEGVPG